MKLGIKLVLWILIIFLGYKLYNSIIGPVHFNQTKEKRYIAVIAKLKDIKAGQLAYQELNGKFTANFDSLVQFLDTAQFAITARRDTSYADVARNRAFGLDPQKVSNSRSPFSEIPPLVPSDAKIIHVPPPMPPPPLRSLSLSSLLDRSAAMAVYTMTMDARSVVPNEMRRR